MENRNFTSKIIPKIQNEDDGEFITKQEDILNEVGSFYSKLYNADSNIDDIDLNEYLKDYDVPKLNHLESESLEGLLTLQEAGKTLKTMKNNRSPGSDGFTTEFFLNVSGNSWVFLL